MANATTVRETLRAQGMPFSRKSLYRLGIELTHDTCRSCGEELPLNAFNRQRGSLTERRSECRACQSENRRFFKNDDDEPYVAAWGCDVPQLPHAMMQAWEKAMSGRRFDEPGMVVRFK